MLIVLHFVPHLQMKLSVLVLLALVALTSASLQGIIKKSSQLRKGKQLTVWHYVGCYVVLWWYSPQ